MSFYSNVKEVAYWIFFLKACLAISELVNLSFNPSSLSVPPLLEPGGLGNLNLTQPGVASACLPLDTSHSLFIVFISAFKNR